MEEKVSMEMSVEDKTDRMDFSVIFNLYYTIVVRSVERIVRERSVAEDLAQDIFWRLYHIPWEEIKNLKAFLLQSGINAAYNYLRMEKRQSSRWERLLSQSSYEELSAETHWLRLEEIESVRSILKEMGERERMLLLLRFEGLSYKEIGEALSINPASVGTLLIRAKEHFRALYLRREEY